MNFMRRNLQFLVAVLAVFCASFVADDVIGTYLRWTLIALFETPLLEGSVGDCSGLYHGYEMIVWMIQALFVVAGFQVARRFNVYGVGRTVEN